jgi:hypothetical protein
MDFLKNLVNVVDFDNNDIDIAELEVNEEETLMFSITPVKTAIDVELTVIINSYEDSKREEIFKDRENYDVSSDKVVFDIIENPNKPLNETIKFPTWAIVAIIVLIVSIMALVADVLVSRRK